jgi:hypothetical protein
VSQYDVTVLLGLVSVLVVVGLIGVGASMLILAELTKQNDLLGTIFTQLHNIIAKMGG